MRIWIVNPFALPPNEPGSSRHYSIARVLQAMGHEVLVVSSPFHYGRRENMSAYSGAQLLGGVSFLWIRAPKYRSNGIDRLWNHLVFSWRLWRSKHLRQREAPDVVVGSSPHPFACLVASYIARRVGAAFVFEVRDLWPATLVELGGVSTWHPMVRLLSALERRLCSKAAQVITLMPGGPEYYAGIGVPPERLHYISNGVDMAMVPKAVRPKAGRAFRIIYAGSLGEVNGVATLIQAAALVEAEPGSQELEVVILGDGAGRSRLENLVATLKVSCVRLCPAIPKEQVYSSLEQADAFFAQALSSPLYRFGVSFNKLFDYLAMARPILFATDLVDNPVTGSGAEVIVPPNDPAALARAIRLLASRTLDERWIMGQAGRAHVESRFAVSELGRRFGLVLEQAVWS